MHNRKSYRGRLFATLPMLALLLLGPAVQAQDIVIDDFETSFAPFWPTVVNTVTNTLVVEGTATSAIGGARQTDITAQSLAVPGVDQIIANVATGPGLFDYVSSSGANGTVLFRYDSGGAGLNADFSGASGIAVNFLDFDHANSLDMPVTITLDDGGLTSSLTHSLISPGAQSLLFNFDDFAGINAMDLSNLQLLDVFFEAQLATDFRIDSITTFNQAIPEPTALAVWSVVACVAGLVYRRRRARSTH